MNKQCRFCEQVFTNQRELNAHAEKSVDCLYKLEELLGDTNDLAEVMFKHYFCVTDDELTFIRELEFIEFTSETLYVDSGSISKSDLRKLGKIAAATKNLFVSVVEFILSDGTFSQRTSYAITENYELVIFSDDEPYHPDGYWLDELLESYIAYKHPQRVIDMLLEREIIGVTKKSLLVAYENEFHYNHYNAFVVEELSSEFVKTSDYVDYYNVIARGFDGVFYAIKQSCSRWQRSPDYTTEILGVIKPRDNFHVHYINDLGSLLVSKKIEKEDEFYFIPLAIFSFDNINEKSFEAAIKE